VARFNTWQQRRASAPLPPMLLLLQRVARPCPVRGVRVCQPCCGADGHAVPPCFCCSDSMGCARTAGDDDIEGRGEVSRGLAPPVLPHGDGLHTWPRCGGQ